MLCIMCSIATELTLYSIFLNLTVPHFETLVATSELTLWSTYTTTTESKCTQPFLSLYSITGMPQLLSLHFEEYAL